MKFYFEAKTGKTYNTKLTIGLTIIKKVNKITPNIFITTN